jgi:anaerobic selenocysteine-containing dehydrogenase
VYESDGTFETVSCWSFSMHGPTTGVWQFTVYVPAGLVAPAEIAKVTGSHAPPPACSSVIVVGETQPKEVHALVHRLNAVLGNVGKSVHYVEEEAVDPLSDVDALKRLTDEMNGGRVETLLILGGNPAYTAPADVPFGEALGRVRESIHLSLYDDETSQRSVWHVNAAHYLESWGDARAWDGTISLIQPLIAPIFGGFSRSASLKPVVSTARSPVRRTGAPSAASRLA